VRERESEREFYYELKRRRRGFKLFGDRERERESLLA
jgi:hypothetical protein